MTTVEAFAPLGIAVLIALVLALALVNVIERSGS